MEPDPDTCVLTVRSLHPGVERSQVVGATGWAVEFADDLGTTAPPTLHELTTLRALQAA
jgi:acyl CoA:acetate/3-ketoacid CoA transferase beta subunit